MNWRVQESGRRLGLWFGRIQEERWPYLGPENTVGALVICRKTTEDVPYFLRCLDLAHAQLVTSIYFIKFIAGDYACLTAPSK